MRRRLDLAASLVDQPEVIFLDEPTTGLDLPSRHAVWAAVAALAASGTTVFLTTQYLEEADRLAHQVAVLDHGRVVARGRPSELKRQVASRWLEVTVAGPEAYDLVIDLLPHKPALEDRAHGLITIGLPDSPGGPDGGTGDAGQVRALLDAVDPRRTLISDFALRQASLDDVFLTLTGRPATPDLTADHDERPAHV
jgi:ABC-2 type transport system ATP-binding protein